MVFMVLLAAVKILLTIVIGSVNFPLVDALISKCSFAKAWNFQ